jgi:hypothetical protein
LYCDYIGYNDLSVEAVIIDRDLYALRSSDLNGIGDPNLLYRIVFLEEDNCAPGHCPRMG